MKSWGLMVIKQHACSGVAAIRLSCYPDHSRVSPPAAICLGVLFRMDCLGSHTAPWEGGDGVLKVVNISAWPRQAVWVNFTETNGETVPATDPSATEDFQEKGTISAEPYGITWGWKGVWEPTWFMLLSLGRRGLTHSTQRDAFLSFSVKCSRVSFCFQTAFLSSSRLWCVRCKVC